MKRRRLNRASVVGLILVVALAAALSIAAAAGAGNRPVVAKGAITRMTTARPAASATAPAAPLGTQVIFSNFGPGFAYDSATGWTVSEPGSPPGLFENANGFVPSAGGQISQIHIALSWVLGTNNATVQLRQDNGGVPGSLIRSWFVANQAPFGSCCAVTTINVSPLIPVGAGHLYWLLAIAGPNLANDTWDAWNFTYNGASTGPNLSWDGSSWLDNTGDPSGAFDIVGCGKLCKVYP